MTALHWAAYNDDLQVVKILLRNGAESTLNSEGYAPVDIAAVRSQWDIVRYFMDNLRKKMVKENKLKKAKKHELTPVERTSTKRAIKGILSKKPQVLPVGYGSANKEIDDESSECSSVEGNNQNRSTMSRAQRHKSFL